MRPEDASIEEATVTRAFLFFDEGNPECRVVKEMLDEKQISYTAIPSSDVSEPELNVGKVRYTGLDSIARGIEALAVAD